MSNYGGTGRELVVFVFRALVPVTPVPVVALALAVLPALDDEDVAP